MKDAAAAAADVVEDLLLSPNTKFHLKFNTESGDGTLVDKIVIALDNLDQEMTAELTCHEEVANTPPDKTSKTSTKTTATLHKVVTNRDGGDSLSSDSVANNESNEEDSDSGGTASNKVSSHSAQARGGGIGCHAVATHHSGGRKGSNSRPILIPVTFVLPP